jgi:SGNH hydrolase-like domain, acetyltransferase AlgX
MRGVIDRIFVLIFAGLLAAPLLQMASHLVPEPTVEERREPRSVPAPFTRLMAMDRHLADDVNGWFNDRFGFRSLLIRLKNEIDYQLFATSDRVMIGRDGWLFDKAFVKAVLSDEKNAGLDQPILKSLRHLRDCLAERGVRLVFVLNPSKISFHQAFLPVELPSTPPSLARRLADVLHHEPGLLFIDGEHILSAHRGETLFQKTDIHMNLKAASYIYREMVAQIAQMNGRPAPVLPPEQWSEGAWHDGSEERFLAKFLPVKDTTYTTPVIFSALRNDDLDTFEYKVGESELQNYSGYPLYDWVFTNKRPSSTLLPPMMLFGTSFADPFFMLKYNEAFETIYRTRSNIPERIQGLMRHLPNEVKIFVLEFPEPLLTSILGLGLPQDCARQRAPTVQN